MSGPVDGAAATPTGDLRPFEVPPVVKVVDVPCSCADAFDAFARIGRWWPLASFSLGRSDAVGVSLEPRSGGRIVERDRDGSEHVWGSVTEWARPTRLAFTWHVGRSPDRAQLVEISFVAVGAATRVRLVHSGWQALGADAGAVRDEYDGGWEEVFVRRYAGHAAEGRQAGAAAGAPSTQLVVVHTPGPAWQHGAPFFEQPGVAEHAAHYRRWLQDGKVALGGPFLDDSGGGMMIAAPDVEHGDLLAFASADPAVRNGLLVAHVRPWLVAMRSAA